MAQTTKVTQSGPNDQSNPKWPKRPQANQIGAKYPKVAQQSKVEQIGLKWTKWTETKQDISHI